MRAPIHWLHTGLMGLSLAALAACSGGDDDGSGAPASQGSAADAALARNECYLGLQVPGITHTGFACSGTDTTSSVSGIEPNAFESALSVSLALAAAPALGDLTLTSLTVTIPEGDIDRTWEAPLDACSAVAIATSREPDFEWDYYRIDISCTEPALPVGDNPGDPLTLGSFVIVTFFAPL